MTTRIAVIGAGIGGITAALALRRAGIEVSVYEQAPQLKALGAAITMTPNAVRIMDGLGLAEAIRRIGYRPPRRLNRTWDSGEVTSVIELGDAAEQKFGAPLLTFHRADLLATIAAGIPAENMHFGKKLVAVDNSVSAASAQFSDGTRIEADALIGADGIHSSVRELLFGPEDPHFTGVVGFRSLVPVERLAGVDISPFTKWWGTQRESEAITCPTSAGREFYIFASIPQASWRQESWTMKGDVAELRACFSGWNGELRRMLDACDDTLKSALYEREPLSAWTLGRTTLLGDACHPMTPFMAQGSAMAIEDAAILSRCLEGKVSAELPRALQVYERSRHARTSRMQQSSQQNQWPQKPVDADWVYGFDAWTSELAD